MQVLVSRLRLWIREQTIVPLGNLVELFNLGEEGQRSSQG